MEDPLSPTDENYGGVEDDVSGTNGKKRKYCGLRKTENSASSSNSTPLSSFFHQYSSTSRDDKQSLVILNQPEQQHRARYQTEGSRGSVKDRDGQGFPTIQLRGYAGSESTLTLQVFIGSDIGRPTVPHVYYQACKVAGKSSTPSTELRQEGTDVILMDMERDNDYTVVVDCVGILKERYSDIELKIPSQKQRTNWKKKSTKCRMVFRVEIDNEEGQNETLQVVSDQISCSQQPGTPEILKMSTESSTIQGGTELWMIGKNFLKDSVVMFQENLSSTEALNRTPWSKTIHPDKDFFNNSHLIVNVPAFGVQNLLTSVEISVFVRCGGKSSDPHSFLYRPCIGSSSNKDPSSTSSSPKSFSPIRHNNRNGNNSRITILEGRPKTEIDYCEDTVFDPERGKNDDKELEDGGSYLYRQPPHEESNSVSFSNNTTTNINNNNLGEDKSSDQITTFSNIFRKESTPNNPPQPPPTVENSPGVMVIPQISSDTLKVAQKELLKNVGDPGSLPTESTIMVNGTSKNNPHHNNASPDSLGTNAESLVKSGTKSSSIYIQGTESDNATISIKLPNSIISNSEKFENVMNTINKALLQPDPTLKSIDSNLARVDISRNNSNSNHGVSETQAVGPSSLVGPSELYPKKQKINEDRSTASESNWLDSWPSTAPTDSSRGKSVKDPTPMDTTPFFTSATPNAAQTWPETQNTVDKTSQLALSIIPELKETATESSWNSVKVETESWSKTTTPSWGTPSETWPAQTSTSAAAQPSEGVWATKPEDSAHVSVNEAPGGTAGTWSLTSGTTGEESKDQQHTSTAEWANEPEKDASKVDSTSWFRETSKIDPIWNEEWATNGRKADESQQQSQWGITEKPTADSAPTWSTESPQTQPTAQSANTTGQTWGAETQKLPDWSKPSATPSAAPSNSEKKDLIVMGSYISEEMTPIDPKKVLYDTSPMEVDGIYSKTKIEYKSPESGNALSSNSNTSTTSTAIKGNPLLSESSAIIRQQQKIESAIIERPKETSVFQPMKFQPTSDVIFPLFSNTSTTDVQK